MTTNVSIFLRGGDNRTDVRPRALGRGLEDLAGVRVRYLGRGDVDHEADLIVQAGFASTRALNQAVKDRKPFIIVEYPHWRPDLEYMLSNASWGYNGLGGGAWHPPIPRQSRPKPLLQPLKTSGETIIFAQKPNDHSLRGHDHLKWVREKMEQYPDATLRHHPLMTHERPEPLASVLDRTHVAVTYTSTVGVEALIYGCVSKPEGRESMAYGVTSREKWAHELSWKQFSLLEYRQHDIASWIMSGYEEAAERAARGHVEIPRTKVDNMPMIQYHQAFSL